MVYRTDGSSHFNGVDLELKIQNFINDSYSKNIDVLNIYDDIKSELGSVGSIRCIHKGGTNNKSDAIVVCSNADGTKMKVLTISIKRKKYENGKAKGTFDIINTTLEKFNNQYDIIPSECISRVDKWLFDKKAFIHSESDIDNIRDEFQDLCSDLLEETVKNADKFISLARREFIKTDILIIGKVVEDCGVESLAEIFIAKEKDLKMFEQEKLQNNSYILDQGRGKSSRRIIVKTSNGAKYKTPYRVRCVLNNGLSAYYGLSNANKYSILTIKIQVDDVEYIINQMNRFKLN